MFLIAYNPCRTSHVSFDVLAWKMCYNVEFFTLRRMLAFAWPSFLCRPLSQPHFGAKCEDETHTPKVGDLESSRTPECLEFNSRDQNTSDWGVLGVIGKVLKCRCPKWPLIGHLDIFSPSYGQKKGQESNWQFDSRPLKVGNRPFPDVYRWSNMEHWKLSRTATTLVQTSLQLEVGARSCECPKSRESNPG
jgi:hypothetical protein